MEDRQRDRQQALAPAPTMGTEPVAITIHIPYIRHTSQIRTAATIGMEWCGEQENKSAKLKHAILFFDSYLYF